MGKIQSKQGYTAVSSANSIDTVSETECILSTKSAASEDGFSLTVSSSCDNLKSEVKVQKEPPEIVMKSSNEEPNSQQDAKILVHVDENNKFIIKKNCTSKQELDENDLSELYFTLYELDGPKKLSKEEILVLVKRIHSRFSDKVFNSGNKAVSIHLTVSPVKSEKKRSKEESPSKYHYVRNKFKKYMKNTSMSEEHEIKEEFRSDVNDRLGFPNHSTTKSPCAERVPHQKNAPSRSCSMSSSFSSRSRNYEEHLRHLVQESMVKNLGYQNFRKPTSNYMCNPLENSCESFRHKSRVHCNIPESYDRRDHYMHLFGTEDHSPNFNSHSQRTQRIPRRTHSHNSYDDTRFHHRNSDYVAPSPDIFKKCEKHRHCNESNSRNQQKTMFEIPHDTKCKSCQDPHQKSNKRHRRRHTTQSNVNDEYCYPELTHNSSKKKNTKHHHHIHEHHHYHHYVNI